MGMLVMAAYALVLSATYFGVALADAALAGRLLLFFIALLIVPCELWRRAKRASRR